MRFVVFSEEAKCDSSPWFAPIHSVEETSTPGQLPFLCCDSRRIALISKEQKLYHHPYKMGILFSIASLITLVTLVHRVFIIDSLIPGTLLQVPPFRGFNSYRTIYETFIHIRRPTAGVWC